MQIFKSKPSLNMSLILIVAIYNDFNAESQIRTSSTCAFCVITARVVFGVLGCLTKCLFGLQRHGTYCHAITDDTSSSNTTTPLSAQMLTDDNNALCYPQ